MKIVYNPVHQQEWCGSWGGFDHFWRFLPVKMVRTSAESMIIAQIKRFKEIISMAKGKTAVKRARKSSKDKYDFSLKNPSVVITPDEEANFYKCMRRKNYSVSADKMPFKEAVESVDMKRLFP
jgi:hypothetical protein